MFQLGTLANLSAYVLALAHLIYDATPSTEQANFYGVRVQVQNFSNFLDGKSFYLFQDQHHTVAFIQALQQILHLLLGLEFVRNILGAAIQTFGSAELLDLLFAEVRFIQKRPNLFLS